MKNFTKGGGFGARKSSGGFGRRDSGGRSFNRRSDDSGRPAMFKAVCAECGETCEVPFKPTGGKPVYCSNCFKGKDNSGPMQSGGRDFGRSNFGDKKMFKAICDNCGETCEVPFKPTAGKPVYCSECFSKGEKSDKPRSNRGDTRGNSSNEQFEILSSKIDKILRILESTPQTRPALKKEAFKETKKSGPKKVLKKPGKKIISTRSKAVKKTKKK